ncbi:MAG: hypothetical protein PHT91_03795 [Candidatus Nanoarchaeia archaeon]|nr:hypothetical protein [Candidatus Nanoarchaeia archaeon]MDD5053758.1 hypothetical protein [Candidatus Nanoarchaeia archaeon]MDD5499967.1 hypothetical protein [Candidatus Nanoarchaeia archaeon]
MGSKKKIIKSKKDLKKKSFVPGIILILIGLLLLLDALSIINLSIDYFMLAAGLILLASYASSKNSGMLFLGIMLTLFSAILLFNLGSLPYFWTLIISISFFALSAEKKKENSLALILGAIFLAISALSFINHYTSISPFPIILIIFGAYLIIKNHGAKK